MTRRPSERGRNTEQVRDLVMLHGWGMSSRAWGRFGELLAAGFRVHDVDLPGHGTRRESEDHDYDRFVDEVTRAWPGATWLGWSLGGMLALKAALRHPGAVERLVLIGAGARFTEGRAWPNGMPAAEFEQFRQLVRKDATRALRRFAAMVADGAGRPSEVRRALRNCHEAEPPGLQALVAGLHVLEALDFVGEMRWLGIPLLVLGGDRDGVCSWRAMRETARLAPLGAWVKVGNASHAPFIEQPGRVADAVFEFINAEAAA